MKTIIKTVIGLFFCVFVAMQVSAQEVEKPFRYETSVFIIHFTEDKQGLNGRSNDEYHPQQMFSLIYDIVIRYVYRMTPFNQSDLSFNINDFAIWHEMIFINNVRGQRLLLGDHVLTDGSGWVQMNDEDYEKLHGIIIDIKERAEYPLTENKDKLVADLVSELSQESEILDYDDHFRSMEKYPGDYSAAKVSSANDKSVAHEINPESISEIKSSVDPQEIGVTSSSAGSTGIRAESSEVLNGQSAVAPVISDMPTQDEPVKITNVKNSDTNENPSLTENTNHSFIYWLLLTGLGMAFVWYYWRKK